MSRLKPHQRPILTRFAFVMPVRTMPAVPAMLFDPVVPCEPNEATKFVVWAWCWQTMKWDVANHFYDYEEARAFAQDADEKYAKLVGVPR